MRVVYAHVDRVAVAREGRALDRDDAAMRAATANENAAPSSLSAVDALVAFATVEAGDGVDAAGVRAAAARELATAADRLRVADVVACPSALLSERAAAPVEAASVLDGFGDAVEDALAAVGDPSSSPAGAPRPGEEGGVNVAVAGFGWRYAVDVAAKAHPFATDAIQVDPGDARVGDDANGDASADDASGDASADDASGDDAAREAKSVFAVRTPEGERVALEAFVDRGSDESPAASPGARRVVRALVPGLDDPESVPAAGTDAASGAGDAMTGRGERARSLDVADRDPLDPEATLGPVGVFVRDALADAAMRAATTATAAARDATAVAGPRALDLADSAVRAVAGRLGDRGHGVPLAGSRVLPDDLGATTAIGVLADALGAAGASDESPFAVRDASAPAVLPEHAAAGGDAISRAGCRTVDASGALVARGLAPAVHEAHADVAAGLDALAAHAEAALAVADACELDALAVTSVSPAFAAEHPDWLDALPGAIDAPVLVAVDPAAPAAWPARVDVHAPTADGATVPTGTARLDAGSLAAVADARGRDADAFDAEALDDADAFDAEALDDADAFDAEALDGAAVVHAAPAGALAATTAAVCDAPVVAAATESERERTPGRSLPDWLAPTHVRVLPVADDLVDAALAVADAFAAAGCRVDVDDRALAVGERIVAAERERVPRYVVVGDDEARIVDASGSIEDRADVDGETGAAGDATGAAGNAAGAAGNAVESPSVPVTDVASGRTRSRTPAAVASAVERGRPSIAGDESPPAPVPRRRTHRVPVADRDA